MKYVWIPEAPKYPGVYASERRSMRPRNCTMDVYAAKTFPTKESCAKWCADNPSPVFGPVEHGFAEGIYECYQR